MIARFILLIITAILLLIANVYNSNLFYLLALFAWLGYLIKPIKDDIEDIKIDLKSLTPKKKSKL